MRLKILLAMRDLSGAPRLVEGLENEGFYVDFVGSGVEALQKLRAPFFDVVLIDLQLAKISGTAIAALLRGVAGGYRQPLFIGLAASPEMSVGHLTHFQAILTLPVTAERLVDAIHRARATRHGAVAGPPKSPPAGGPPGRILLVEDDALFSSILANALREEGYVVECVADGVAALRLTRDGLYDLALIDFQLPGLDGLATAQQAWARHVPGRRPTLIALTGAPGKLLSQDPYRPMLFDEILCKSGGLGAVLRAVRRHLPGPPASAAVALANQPAA